MGKVSKKVKILSLSCVAGVSLFTFGVLGTSAQTSEDYDIGNKQLSIFS